MAVIQPKGSQLCPGKKDRLSANMTSIRTKTLFLAFQKILIPTVLDEVSIIMNNSVKTNGTITVYVPEISQGLI